MNVLMISADPRIMVSGSGAAERMREYAGLFDELHIVVMTREQGHNAQHGNLFLYRAAGRTLLARAFFAWHLSLSCLARSQPDVISSQGADETGIVGWLLHRRFRIPFQLQIHTDIMSPWYRRASWKERLRYWLAQFLIPRANCIRVVSERIRRSLISLIKNKELCMTVLPIFTDVSRFLASSSNPKTNRRFAGYDFKMIAVGRFVDREKNFSMLIDVMREFVGICPRAILVIVGEGPDRHNYERHITNYKLEKNVIIEPWRDDLPSFYQSFDLFVSPSNYEGWGRAVVEAMAAGLPVIMTDTGLAGEVVRDGENGIVVPVGDTQAFFQAIQGFYRDGSIRIGCGAAAQATVAAYLPKTKEEYLALYKKSFLACL